MHIANTVYAVATLNNSLARRIMDRSSPLTYGFVSQVLNLTQFTWHGRRPTTGLDAKGRRRSTNLDLLSVLVELHKRKAHIELDSYQNALPWRAYADERHVGGTKRFGTITGLVSHREHLSFSVRMRDESVLCTDGEESSLGATRNYLIADHAGAWHQGWHGLTWDYSEEERLYLERRQLLCDERVDFSDYVHHNRRQSIYGAPYLLLKLLWQRIEDELMFYESECARLDRLGVELPTDLEPASRHLVASGESRSIECPVFTVALVGPKYTGEYTPVSDDQLGYQRARQLVGFLAQKLRPVVQFVVRADEVAFYRFGLEAGFVASWIRGPQWMSDSTGSTTMIVLDERLALSYRVGTVEKRVAA